MMNDPRRTTDAATLRQRAEELLKGRPVDARGPPSEHELQRLVHELQVHQIELEMQNEELRGSRAALELAVERYADLYDFAPTGYFTLARDGTILAVNLTGAKLVGSERDNLLSRKLALFVSDADRSVLHAFLEKIFSSLAPGYCEMAIPRPGTSPLFVRIDATPAADGHECRAAMLDVTERRKVEEERDRLLKDLQDAAARIKVLGGLLPICSHCKKIRDDKGYWAQLETYISEHSEAMFSHGICPACMRQHYPEFIT